MTTKNPLKIKYIIAGATWCGTTSLHAYLVQHPKISGYPKESHQFDRDTYWRFHNKLHGNLDATPQYFSLPRIAKRVYDYDPTVKVVVLLRNPTARIWSGFWKNTDIKPKNKTHFVELVDTFFRENTTPHSLNRFNNYFFAHLTKCNYPFLEEWLKCFPNMFIIKSEDFFADPQKIFVAVQKYFGVDPITLSKYAIHRPASRGKKIPRKPKELLDEYFADRWNEIWNKVTLQY